MWYSRKNLVDEFNNNPEQFLRCFGYMLDFHRPIIIKRSHNGHGGLYWQYDLKPPLVEAQSWGETIDLPEYGDEVIAGPTSDWMAILGGLMKAVNTGSMVDDAERIAAGILDTERSFLPSKNAGFRIQIDAYLYMAATSPLPEGA